MRAGFYRKGTLHNAHWHSRFRIDGRQARDDLRGCRTPGRVQLCAEWLTVTLDVTSRSDAEAAVEVRPRGLDGIAAGRDRTVRHYHHRRQSRLLSRRAPHGAIHELRRTIHCRLRRTKRTAGGVLEISKRPAIWGPGQARARSSRLRTRNSRRATSWLAPMQSPLRSRRSPT